MTTVHGVDKAYGVLTLTVFNTVLFRSYTLRPTFLPLLKHFANSSLWMSNNIFVEFRLMSSVASNRCPFRTFLSLGNRKKHIVRYLVSMAAAATQQCRVWPKTATQDVKCVRAHCRGAGSSRHPVIFPVVFGELSPRRSHSHPLSLILSISCYCEGLF